MSLDFNTIRCPDGPMKPQKDWEGNDEQEHAWIQGIVFSLMNVHLGGYDDDTLGEFVYRVRLLEQIGWGVTRDPIPLDMIRRWRGITVNIVPVTRQRFHQQLIRAVSEEVARDVKKELAK